jgi:hypothetical protein
MSYLDFGGYTPLTYSGFNLYYQRPSTAVAPTTAVSIPPAAVAASTGVNPVETSYSLYGHPIPLSVFGVGRIGGEIISGPWIENGLASFIISFGVPADPTGTRDLREIAFDSEVVWTAAGGFNTEAFTYRFYGGTLTQAADALETTHFGANAVAYRPQMLLAFENLPLANTKFGKIPYVAAKIGDATGDDVNLGEAFERIAYSPWVGYTSSQFETVGITDGLVNGGMIFAQQADFLTTIQQFGRFYPNWDILQTDKLRIVDRGSNVTADVTLDKTRLMDKVTISRAGADTIARELELSTIDPDADYTIVPSLAQRPRAPVAVTTSVTKDTAYLPVIMDSPTRISIATYAKYHEEQARKTISGTAMIYGLEMEPGDFVAMVGLGEDFQDEVFKVVETLHGANYAVEFTAQAILRCGTTGGTTHPAFVNARTTASQSTSVHTADLPTGRTTGNLLIFYFQVASVTNDPTVSAGWTLIDTFGFGSGTTLRYGAYYCYVTGSEVAPTLTWAGGGHACSLIAEYENVAPSSPVVPGTKNGASSGTAISTAATVSSRDNSLFISATWSPFSVACTVPPGFTSEFPGGPLGFDNFFGSLMIADKAAAFTSTSSGAVACTQIGSSFWGTLLFELRSAP